MEDLLPPSGLPPAVVPREDVQEPAAGPCQQSRTNCRVLAAGRRLSLMDERRTRELRARITRSAGVFAVDRSDFYRGNLARAMRRAIAAGLRHEQVIALSVLPREEAEQLISDG